MSPDAGVLTAIGHSPLALGALARVTYRVARLNDETVVPSRSLYFQCGAGYKHARRCRWRFRRALEAIKEPWDGIDAEPREKERLFRPYSPSVLSSMERADAKGSDPIQALAHKR